MTEEENTQSKSDNGRIEGLFSKLGKRLDELMEKARNGELRSEVEGSIDELKRTGAKLEDDFKDWKDRNQDRWKETEDSMDRTAKIIRDGIKDIVDKVRQESKKGKGSGVEDAEVVDD